MLSGPSFWSTFVYSINSLILPDFPLTSFHLAEASLSTFSWFYTLVCAVVQKYRKMSFIYTSMSVQSFHGISTGELITSFSTSSCFLKISRRFG